MLVLFSSVVEASADMARSLAVLLLLVMQRPNPKAIPNK